MAVSVKVMNGLAALKKLEVDPGLYEWLKNSPVTVSLTAKCFKFSLPEINAGVASETEVPVSLTQLQQLHTNKLPASEKIALRSKVEVVILTIKEYLEAHNAVPSSPTTQS